MTDYTTLKALAEAANRSGHYTPLHKVMTPDVVLDMLDENDRLRSLLREWRNALTLHSRIQLHEKTEKELTT